MPDYNLKIRVISQKGHCGIGHKVGDEWLVAGTTPGGMCIAAFSSMLSQIQVMRFDGAFPWASDRDVTTLACSDAQNPVVFELRRVKK